MFTIVLIVRITPITDMGKTVIAMADQTRTGVDDSKDRKGSKPQPPGPGTLFYFSKMKFAA
jgi:hypothetical protein